MCARNSVLVLGHGASPAFVPFCMRGKFPHRLGNAKSLFGTPHHNAETKQASKQSGEFRAKQPRAGKVRHKEANTRKNAVLPGGKANRPGLFLAKKAGHEAQHENGQDNCHGGMHKGRPLAYSRTKPVIILEGQIGVGGNGFRHKIFKKAETNDNRRAHCPKGNWHGVEHQADHGCGHGRKAQSKQQGRGKSGRSAKAGSAFNKGSKHEANNDGLQTAVTADALHAALDGFHAAAFFKSIKNKNCAKNNNQNANGNDNALERQSKQIGGR